MLLVSVLFASCWGSPGGDVVDAEISNPMMQGCNEPGCAGHCVKHTTERFERPRLDIPFLPCLLDASSWTFQASRAVSFLPFSCPFQISPLGHQSDCRTTTLSRRSPRHSRGSEVSTLLYSYPSPLIFTGPPHSLCGHCPTGRYVRQSCAICRVGEGMLPASEARPSIHHCSRSQDVRCAHDLTVPIHYLDSLVLAANHCQEETPKWEYSLPS